MKGDSILKTKTNHVKRIITFVKTAYSYEHKIPNTDHALTIFANKAAEMNDGLVYQIKLKENNLNTFVRCKIVFSCTKESWPRIVSDFMSMAQDGIQKTKYRL